TLRDLEAFLYVLSIENDRGLHLVHRLATVTGLDTAVVGRQYNHRIIHDTRLTNGIHHLRQATVQMIHHREILRGAPTLAMSGTIRLIVYDRAKVRLLLLDILNGYRGTSVRVLSRHRSMLTEAHGQGIHQIIH